MKYMTFNNSCSYCALANMLENFSIDVTDKDICIKLGLPYLMFYDVRDDSFSAGTQLQGSTIFNLYLETVGLYFYEYRISKKDIPAFLKKNPNSLIGLKIEGRKHAVVFKKINNGKYMFLNPHKDYDKQLDYLEFEENELLASLDDIQAVGFLKKIVEQSMMSKFLHANTLSSVHYYQTKMIEFLYGNQDKQSIEKKLNTLLRTFALDLYEMMKLVDEKSITAKLEKLKNDVISLKSQTNTIKPIDYIDIKNFKDIIKEYEQIVKKYIQ